MADFIHRSLQRATTDGAEALIIQMSSKGAVASRDRMAQLAREIHDSPVLVAIWVGPSGSSAFGLSGQLLGAAAVTGMSPGSHLGHFGDPLVVPGVDLRFGNASDTLRNGTLSADQARQQGALRLGKNDTGTPVLGDMVVVLDGVTYNGRTLATATVVTKDGEPRRQPIVSPRFFKLELVPRLMHTVASPPVAYLLLIIGLALLVFEFFTAGVGIAGVTGAVCFLLSCYGLAVLPARWWAVGLLVAAILAYAIDVQVGVPRFWTWAGSVMLVAGSLTLYHGLSLSWITLLGGIGGMLLTFLVGMPTMVRTRFATPTIGRAWMIGEMGEAVVPVDPDGVVRVRDAQWRARTNRATPIPAGDPIRVVAIDGIVLEVEPETGGARDHRERARRGNDT
jgi:membrane-bound serine protease (ClpP class)